MVVGSVVVALVVGCIVALVIRARKHPKSYDLQSLAETQYPKDDGEKSNHEDPVRDFEAQQYTNVNSLRNGPFF